jgi:hypothetical protein
MLHPTCVLRVVDGVVGPTLASDWRWRLLEYRSCRCADAQGGPRAAAVAASAGGPASADVSKRDPRLGRRSHNSADVGNRRVSTPVKQLLMYETVLEL